MSTAAPLNLGPNPRRRESFSSSYKPFETTATTHPDGRPHASNVVVETVVDEAVVEEDDEVEPLSPRAFVRGNRSFSASQPQTGAQNKSHSSGQSSTSAELAKSPQEGGWWYGGIKEF